MPKWAAALAAVAAGIRNAKLIVLSDSTGAGAYATTTSTTTPFLNARANSWPVLVGAALGYNTEGFAGTNNTMGGTLTLPAWDPRFTDPANWVQNVNTLGAFFLENSADTATLVLVPTDPFDTVEVWCPGSVGLGTLNVDIDGGTPVSINQLAGSGAGYTKTIVTASGGVGTHVVNLKRVSGPVFVGAILPYSSAAKQVLLLPSSWNAGKVADTIAAANAYDPLNALKTQAPDLTIICLTINDALANTPTATFEANTQTLIDAAKVTGDVILMTGVPSDPATTPTSQQDAKAASYRKLAASNDLNLIDLYELWGSYAIANAEGYMANALHPNGAGYVRIASTTVPYL